MPNNSQNLGRLEQEIHQSLIPAIVGKSISEEERNVISLPIRSGGLGISKPNEESDYEYIVSQKVTQNLKEIIKDQVTHPARDQLDMASAKKEVRRERDARLNWKHSSDKPQT